MKLGVINMKKWKPFPSPKYRDLGLRFCVHWNSKVEVHHDKNNVYEYANSNLGVLSTL